MEGDGIGDAQAKAMQAIFDLCEAIGDDALSMGDLADVMRLAVGGGHNRIMICMHMVLGALRSLPEEGDGNGD